MTQQSDVTFAAAAVDTVSVEPISPPSTGPIDAFPRARAILSGRPLPMSQPMPHALPCQHCRALRPRGALRMPHEKACMYCDALHDGKYGRGKCCYRRCVCSYASRASRERMREILITRAGEPREGVVAVSLSPRSRAVRRLQFGVFHDGAYGSGEFCGKSCKKLRNGNAESRKGDKKSVLVPCLRSGAPRDGTYRSYKFCDVSCKNCRGASLVGAAARSATKAATIAAAVADAAATAATAAAATVATAKISESAATIDRSEPLPMSISADGDLANDIWFICLGSYDAGDGVKTLSCVHEFHAACCDDWIYSVDCCCSICKRDVVDGEALSIAHETRRN